MPFGLPADFDPYRTGKLVRQKSNFLSDFNLIWVVQFFRQK